MDLNCIKLKHADTFIKCIVRAVALVFLSKILFEISAVSSISFTDPFKADEK